MDPKEQSKAVEDALRSTEEGRAFLASFEERVVANVLSRFEDFTAALKHGVDYSVEAGARLSGVDEVAQHLPASDEALTLLRQIFEKISTTKEQLSSITEMAREREFGGFNGVGDELHAIIHDTEQATHKILDAVDEIEGVLRGTPLPEDIAHLRRRITDVCTQIQIACSFQDITAQRVKKVVEVVQMIDSQIGAIERKLSSPVDDAISSDGREQQKSAGLLDGPALPGGASVNQSDIDALFDD